VFLATIKSDVCECSLIRLKDSPAQAARDTFANVSTFSARCAPFVTCALGRMQLLRLWLSQVISDKSFSQIQFAVQPQNVVYPSNAHQPLWHLQSLVYLMAKQNH